MTKKHATLPNSQTVKTKVHAHFQLERQLYAQNDVIDSEQPTWHVLLP